MTHQNNLRTTYSSSHSTGYSQRFLKLEKTTRLSLIDRILSKYHNFRMNRQRKQKIRDIQSDDELSESGPEISDAEDYAEGMILSIL